MRAPTIAGLFLLTCLPALAAVPAAPAVGAARVAEVAAAREAALAAGTAAGPGASNAARLAALRGAMDGMAVVEPDDVLALRAAIRRGAKPAPGVEAALRRLDAVEARAAARVLAAVTGPTPVRLDAEPEDVPPPTLQASR